MFLMAMPSAFGSGERRISLLEGTNIHIHIFSQEGIPMLRKYFRDLDKMKLLGRLLGCALAFAIFAFATPIKMAFAAATPPLYTTSWYMDTTTPASLPTAAYNMGCTLGTHDLNTPGTQDDVVILLFGKPGYSNNTYGAYDWISPGNINNPVFVTSAQIASSVENFGAGYWACTGSDSTSQLFVAAGVNNSGSGETYNHGSAWATMTTSISSWIITNGYSSQVTVRAAGDMEPGINTSTPTIAWVNGYSASYGSGLWLYNVGSADGCPSSGTDTASSPCNNSWTVDNVWYVSYGPTPLFALPEIYNTAGVNGIQWGLIDNYKYIYFAAALTQSQACGQLGHCSGIDYTPAQGWTNLWNNVNTKQSVLRWSTDMKWK
jgi:hypothetical protein